MSRLERDAAGAENRRGKKSRWKTILAAELLIAAVLAGVIFYLHTESMKKDDQMQLASELSDSEAPGEITEAADNSAESARQSVKGAKDPETAAGESGRTRKKGQGGHGKNGGYIVYIETGHGTDMNGNWDTGCTWSDGTTEYQEAKVMIPVVQSMVKYLRKSGVEVVTDADDGKNASSLFAALDYMEVHQMDAFVNVHCDYDEAEPGTMPLYRTDEQKELGLALSKGVHEYIDIADRGPQYREDLDTLNSEKPKCPACLFECGNISDNNKILTEQYDEYGKGLAKGLCDYLGVDFAGD